MAKNNPDELLLRIGQRIAEVRRRRGWTQEEFAGKLEVNTRHVQSVEAGRENMSIRTLAYFADVLGVEVRQLLWKPRSTEPIRLPPRRRKR